MRPARRSARGAGGTRRGRHSGRERTAARARGCAGGTHPDVLASPPGDRAPEELLVTSARLPKEPPRTTEVGRPGLFASRIDAAGAVAGREREGRPLRGAGSPGRCGAGDSPERGGGGSASRRMVAAQRRAQRRCRF